ncbi:MAG: hypothetical protein E7620_08585 [Ruminococcaceae bacterium]|nr:hypothetical protein [Oscillospiraceae bacterium]
MRFKKLFTTLCLSSLLLSLASPAFGEERGFLDVLTFFGESTTTHLRSRSIIPSERVWANASGTAKLDSTLLVRPLLFQDGERTPAEAARRERPPVLVLSFGLNGILYFSDHPNVYLESYRQLIQEIHEASPDTYVLVQTVYPVADGFLQKDWRFSVSPKEINRRISLLNENLPSLREDFDFLDVIDTASPLTDEGGYLKSDFTTDGIHLNEQAYAAVLERFRQYVLRK